MKTITYIRAMKVIGVGFSCLLSLSLPAQIAGSQGPSNGSVFQNSPINGAGVAWVNVQNVQYEDGISASSGPLNGSDKKTDYLVVTGFNFSLPGTCIVTGVEVIVNRSSSDLQRTKDFVIKLVKNGIISGQDNSYNCTWDLLSNPVTYGNNNDLWGLSPLTVSDVNASDFGVAISVRKNGGGSGINVSIDNIQVKIYYNDIFEPTDPPITLTPKKEAAVPGINNSHSCSDLSFSILQNPSAGGDFSLKFKEQTCDVLVMLYDIMGREQYAKVTVNANSASFIEAIECDKKLAPGMYLVIATNRDEMYKQILVMK